MIQPISPESISRDLGDYGVLCNPVAFSNRLRVRALC